MTYSSKNGSSQSPFSSWRPGQVGVIALVVLLLGIVLGYLFHNSSSSGIAASASSTSQTAAAAPPDSLDSTVQPLLERLRSNPVDPDLLAQIGNAYYDNRNWSKAVEYYQRSLQVRPEDVNARTDMGTAIWYSGDPDGAIHQYEIALRYRPDYPNTLLNMGIVKWQGKQDRWGALESWQKLLTTHPDYPGRQKVEQLIQKVQAESK